MSIVCPKCCVFLDEAGKCPHCYEMVNNGDWGDEVIRLIEKQLHSPSKEIISSGENGEIVGNFSDGILLENLDGFHRIGSDAASCDILVRNVAPIHAVVYKNRNTHQWWIANACLENPAQLNRQNFVNSRLFRGDRITIAGLHFLFAGDRLVVSQALDQGIAIEVSDLTVRKGETKENDDPYILKNLNFKIEPGEFVGILGPSGCGKSSVLERLIGLARYDEGSIKLNQSDFLAKKDIFQRLTAFVPQDVALHNDFTLEEEVSIFCKIRGIRKEQAELDDVLDLVGLREKKGQRIGDFSGGQKRRVGIALELLREPLLFVLDEPTAGLDPATETDVMNYLKHIAQQGKTVLCSTHIMGNLNLFDKVLLLSKGREAFFGTPAELMNHFGIASPLLLYRRLGEGDQLQQIQIADDEAERFRASIAHVEYVNDTPANPRRLDVHKTSPLASFCGYLRRQLLDFISFRNAKKPIRGFFTSAFFIQLLLQPILAAVVIKFSCTDYFYGETDYFKLFFFSSLAVFWLGLNNSIREFVKERVPWRCLERLEKISLVGYILSKISWSFILSIVQVLIFSAIAFSFPKLVYLITPRNSQPLDFHFYPSLLILICVCFCGALISLVISAGFKKENAAISLLPIILIPILFFSKPIVNYTDYSTPSDAIQYFPDLRKMMPWIDQTKSDTDLHCSRYALLMSSAMPCNQPAQLLFCQNKEKKEEEHLSEARRGYFQSFTFYSTFALLLIFLLQWLNEEGWHGR